MSTYIMITTLIMMMIITQITITITITMTIKNENNICKGRRDVLEAALA
jgi:hypothetical protein